ncbi:Lpp/OprI family alanine-zipper lipoprotein [Marinimicrobium sp. C2-29]|uniref:Lpp/OprI family alanine-zipper lipoprotein n=1 Tax=Marinimicrobium sp. C2-29 TaxID=3139825 RepID=UPI00313921FE
MIVKKLASMSGIAVLSLGLLAGCATNSSEVEQAQTDAERALQVAEEAKQIAQEASRKADSAQSSADSANQCCQDNRQKLDRAMERMQEK